MPAGAVDLGPHVEGGRCRCKHDQKLLFQTKSAHAGGGVEAARPGKDLPGDSVGGALVDQLPHMR